MATAVRGFASVLLSALAACGGGGGGGGGTESTQATPFSVGATVSGLNGTVVLQNNGSNDLSTSANGSVTFSATLIAGNSYSVTVLTQPAGQSCTVANGSGTMPAANVTGVTVACTLVAPTVSVQPGVKQLRLSWAANPAATHYRVLENPDGSVYTQLGPNLTSATYTLDLNGMLLSRRVNASYLIQSCYSFGCSASDPLDLVSQLVKAIGYFKASNTGAGDFFGSSLALSADGSTLAVGASEEDGDLIKGIKVGDVNETTAGNGASSSGAVYVYTRSGNIWSQQAYVKASNAEAGDQFGASLALSGDGSTLAVGAIGEDSARTGVTAGFVDDATAGNGASNSGAVYVFTYSTSTFWMQRAYVKASNTGARDAFGTSVALSADGNTLAVGAPGESSVATGIGGNQADNSAVNAGAVYVFTRLVNTNTWSQQAYAKASNPGAGHDFGFSVALSGDGNTLAVGANSEDSALTGTRAGAVDQATAGTGAPNSGAVYVFTRSLSTTWSQQAYVKPSNTGAMDHFGSSVALSGDGSTLAVGANDESSALTGVIPGFVNDSTTGNAADAAGAVYVFTRSGTTWSQQAYVKASNTAAHDSFGWSLALSADGNTLAVGALGESSALTGVATGAVNDATAGNGAPASGAVYVFTFSGTTWSQHAYVKASNTATGDEFGFRVALSGDGNTLAVGASNQSGAGAVYLY